MLTQVVSYLKDLINYGNHGIFLNNIIGNAGFVTSTVYTLAPECLYRDYSKAKVYGALGVISLYKYGPIARLLVLYKGFTAWDCCLCS